MTGIVHTYTSEVTKLFCDMPDCMSNYATEEYAAHDYIKMVELLQPAWDTGWRVWVIQNLDGEKTYLTTCPDHPNPRLAIEQAWGK